MFLCRGMEEPMKKNITKKAAVFLLSTIVAAQSGLSVQAAALTEGKLGTDQFRMEVFKS